VSLKKIDLSKKSNIIKIKNMKTIIIVIALLITGSAMSFAQCDKKIKLTTSKTEHLDASGTVQRTDEEKAVVEIGKSDLNVSVNDEHKITGKIKSAECNWSVPYKEGKTVIKATASGQDGGDKNVTITIEGKAGKVTLLFEIEGEPDDRIRVAIDKFEEVG
jgi:hypothetical protein